MTADGTIDVPARAVPLPASLSEQARFNAIAYPPIALAPFPPHDDPAAWHDHLAVEESRLLAMVRGLPEAPGIAASEVPLGPVTVHRFQPATLRAPRDCACLDIHGGAFILGRGETCRVMGSLTAKSRGVLTWAPDYRMPPEHPYPAALDDCLTAYRALLETHRPEKIVVSGLSAGGNLAAAMILRARDEGLPLPGGCVLITPEVDLTEAGDSFHANLGLDNCLVRSLMPANLLYAAGHDLAHPYLSPLNGDFTAGFPPTLITSGTRDLFLSNAVRMHWALRAAGVPAELYILEAGTHTGHQGSPEGQALEREIDRFCMEIWSA
jgi:acetyl esterase/lipase